MQLVFPSVLRSSELNITAPDALLVYTTDYTSAIGLRATVLAGSLEFGSLPRLPPVEAGASKRRTGNAVVTLPPAMAGRASVGVLTVFNNFSVPVAIERVEVSNPAYARTRPTCPCIRACSPARSIGRAS